MADSRLISADSHFVEPPTMWAERLERRFRDRAPHAVRLDGKPGEYFVCEDLAPAPLGVHPRRQRRQIVGERTGSEDAERVERGARLRLVARVADAQSIGKLDERVDRTALAFDAKPKRRPREVAAAFGQLQSEGQRVVAAHLDPLADDHRLLYVDGRGQGRSERVDPKTLTLDVFARDVDLLAESLQLDRFALLGHSFGAIITTFHAIELGTADAYVISAGGDASDLMMADVEASLEAMGDEGKAIATSWEQEQTVATEEELAELLRAQMPFHFHGPVPPGYGDDTLFSPDVLRHFAQVGYGNFDFTPELVRIDRPTLVIVGDKDRTTTPRAARVLHEGIPGSELVVVEGAGHMSFVERPDEYLAAVRSFLSRAR